MAKIIFANTVSTTTTGVLNISHPTLVVDDDDSFPVISDNDYFFLTLFELSGSVEVNVEIVKVVAKLADSVYTIVRAQENTADQSHVVGTFVEGRYTAGNAGAFTQNADAAITGGTVAATLTGSTGLEAAGVALATSGAVGDVNDIGDFVRHIWSTGVADGGAITLNAGAGTIDIAASDFVTRQGSAEDSPLVVYRDPGVTGLALTANEVSFVYRDYNGGTPVWASTLTLSGFNGIDKVIAYAVSRNGASMCSVDARGVNVDAGRKQRRKAVEFTGYVYNGFWQSSVGKSTLTASGRNLLATNGKYYWFDNPITHYAFDTTVAGADPANNWITFYNRTGAWTQVTGQKSVENQQYDNAGTLTNMTGGQYRTDWVYVVMCSAMPYLVLVLGNAQYTTLALAQAVPPPATIPPQIDGACVLLGQVVILKNAASVAVQVAGSSTFSLSTAAPTSFSDATFNITDDADSSKVIAFQASGVTTATTRTLAAPDANGTIALTSGHSPTTLLQQFGAL